MRKKRAYGEAMHDDLDDWLNSQRCACGARWLGDGGGLLVCGKGHRGMLGILGGRT